MRFNKWAGADQGPTCLSEDCADGLARPYPEAGSTDRRKLILPLNQAVRYGRRLVLSGRAILVAAATQPS